MSTSHQFFFVHSALTIIQTIDLYTAIYGIYDEFKDDFPHTDTALSPEETRKKQWNTDVVV